MLKLTPLKTNEKVQREQVRLLYSQGYIIQILGLISSLVVLFIYWDVVEHTKLIAWFITIVIVYIIRLRDVKKFRKLSVNEFDIKKWKNTYIISTFISGIIWSLLALFFESSWQATHQVALFIIYVGIIAGAFNSNATVFVSYLAFYIPLTAMLMYMILNQENELSYQLAFLISLYAILMYVTAIKYHNFLVNSLELRFTNENLVKDLKSANTKLTYLADTDELSQIDNRRSMNKYLLKEWQWHFENKKPISLLVIDIDFFKLYNDTYGHSMGDKCILEVANILQKNIRSDIDMASRYGGEEFVVILHNTDELKALNIAQRILLDVLSKQIPHSSSGISEYLTVSIGLGSMIPSMPNSQIKLFDLADTRLYKAKQNGRNQIMYN